MTELKGIEGGLFIALIDMGVVFFVLGMIACVMVLLAKVVKAIEDGGSSKVTPVVQETDHAAIVASDSDEIDDETLAAISAAVAVVMKGKRYRVAKLAGYDMQTARWAMAGRQKLLLKG